MFQMRKWYKEQPINIGAQTLIYAGNNKVQLRRMERQVQEDEIE